MNFFQRIFGRREEAASGVEMFPPSDGQPRTIFGEERLNAELARDGVVVFSWLEPADIERLGEIVRSLAEPVDFSDAHIPTRFRLSAFTNDSAYKTRLYDEVYGFLADRLATLLPGYVPLVVNVFEKQPGAGEDSVPIHQNPSFVGEPDNKSVSIWIPLQAVNKDNGTVGVLRGSHNRFNPMRAGNMPHEFVFGSVAQELETSLFEPLDMQPGEVAVLDDSIVHWSYPNSSSSVRTAVQLIMVPTETDHIYYYYNDNGAEPVMDLYEVDKNFFFNFNCKELPEGLKKIGTVPYRYAPVTRDLLLSQK